MTPEPNLEGAEVCIFGGTGSLGQRLFRRILTGEHGLPASITVLSRDEAKQHYMRLELLNAANATDEVIYRESAQRVRFAIGDVRQYEDVRAGHRSLRRDLSRRGVQAGARMRILCQGGGGHQRLRRIQPGAGRWREGSRRTRTVVGISTDKACKPVNVMGMTKALQERVLIQGCLEAPWVRFVNVRYGNVMASRGSAIPLFVSLVRQGTPISITDERMTRFPHDAGPVGRPDLRRAHRRTARGNLAAHCAYREGGGYRACGCGRCGVAAQDHRDPARRKRSTKILVSEEETSRTTLQGAFLVTLPDPAGVAYRAQLDCAVAFCRRILVGAGHPGLR